MSDRDRGQAGGEGGSSERLARMESRLPRREDDRLSGARSSLAKSAEHAIRAIEESGDSVRKSRTASAADPRSSQAGADVRKSGAVRRSGTGSRRLAAGTVGKDFGRAVRTREPSRLAGRLAVGMSVVLVVGLLAWRLFFVGVDPARAALLAYCGLEGQALLNGAVDDRLAADRSLFGSTAAIVGIADAEIGAEREIPLAALHGHLRGHSRLDAHRLWVPVDRVDEALRLLGTLPAATTPAAHLAAHGVPAVDEDGIRARMLTGIADIDRDLVVDWLFAPRPAPGTALPDVAGLLARGDWPRTLAWRPFAGSDGVMNLQPSGRVTVAFRGRLVRTPDAAGWPDRWLVGDVVVAGREVAGQDGPHRERNQP